MPDTDEDQGTRDAAMTRPLCFVLMPFGTKPRPGGGSIDFDAVYAELIAPAVEAADMEPLRADEEQAGGIIHKAMFERLILCEYAVADLTAANANVFYELGVRHAIRPASTVLLFAEGGPQLPFDVAPLRALPYALGADGRPSKPQADREGVCARLQAARAQDTDSPLFQLVEDYPDVQRLKTDVFREQVDYSADVKRRLAAARNKDNGPDLPRGDLDALRAVEQSLGPVHDTDGGVVVDLFLSYRALKAWDEMVRLVEQMSRPLQETVMVREQLALALNRAGRGDEAETVLRQIIEQRGPSSETYGILGRVYKDRWDAAAQSGREAAEQGRRDAARLKALARGELDKAIDAYVKGFESDWRDAYPGINAVTLMELREPPDPRREELLPVVTYAVQRRVAAGKPDYWDHATLLELAVLAADRAEADRLLAATVAAMREDWEGETTARNLGLIRRARTERGEDASWVADIEAALAPDGE